ncbi:amidohydrolase [Mangrovibacterium lignilyticum]|uniref:amidohydrolase n=1 Tax=Mangrovibacterium lignilyticum TaxID=2668052 RepID=UPI0013D05EAF|nr:amidohydrolase [Mangrovibacterium lignilyticum]
MEVSTNNQNVLTLSLIQADLVWEDVNANLRNFESMFGSIPSNVDLVVLPEMFSTGFSMQVERFAEPMDGETVSWMKKQAASLNTVLAGSLMIRENTSFRNRFVFVRPDGRLEFYDKRHLFSMGQENDHFMPGKERKIVELNGFRILPQVCYDLRFPVFSRNRNDYDLLLNCANWPAPRKDVWLCLLKARAIENQAFVAGVNRVGSDANGIHYSGDSLIYDARGSVLEHAGNAANIVVQKLSLESLLNFRSKFPVLPDGDDYTLYL